LTPSPKPNDNENREAQETKVKGEKVQEDKVNSKGNGIVPENLLEAAVELANETAEANLDTDDILKKEEEEEAAQRARRKSSTLNPKTEVNLNIDK